MKNTQSTTNNRTLRVQQIVQSHLALNSIVEIKLPQGIATATLNDNLFTDFVGLESSTSLEYLCVDRNPILSFRGFPSLPNLTNLSMIDTPISKLANFRALAVLVAGTQLKVLNGSEVTSNDRAAALAYGPPEYIGQFVVRGWLPKRPVSIPSRASKKNPNLPTDCRILKLVDDQENDPVTVRVTRLLRSQGLGIPQIREFLRDFFGPHQPKHAEPKPTKEESAIEAQIKKQQQIIDVLAAQLQALRSGNRTFNDYDDMIRTAGANLLKNAELLQKSENEPDNKMATTKSQTKKSNKEEYELLRKAVIDFLQVDEDEDDESLIKLLDSIDIESESEKAQSKRSSRQSSRKDDHEEYTEENVLLPNEEEDIDEEPIPTAEKQKIAELAEEDQIPTDSATLKPLPNQITEEEEEDFDNTEAKEDQNNDDENDQIVYTKEDNEISKEEKDDLTDNTDRQNNDIDKPEEKIFEEEDSHEIADDDNYINDPSEQAQIKSDQPHDEEEEDILKKINKIFEEEDEEEFLEDDDLHTDKQLDSQPLSNEQTEQTEQTDQTYQTDQIEADESFITEQNEYSEIVNNPPSQATEE